MDCQYILRWGLLCTVVLSGCGADVESSAPAPSDDPGAGLIAQADVPAPVDAADTLGDIDESAVALLKKMTSTIAALPEFSVTLETGFDVLQPSGQKLEFGSRRTATISRPDRARFTFLERAGVEGELVFDGTMIYAYDAQQNVYAAVEQPGDIDASLDLVTVELGIPVPVSDFFAADPAPALAADVLEAQDLGLSTIDNQLGRQVALRKPGADYQIWINEATSLPIRVVITYLDEPGQPQFWAQFLSWNIDQSASNGFEFSPPEGAERIRFAVFDSSQDAGEVTP